MKSTRVLNLIGAIVVVAVAIGGTLAGARKWALIILWPFAIFWLIEAIYKLSHPEKRLPWDANWSKICCPGCGDQMPRVRFPRSFRQAMLGGQTCPKCGCEVDRWGKVV